MESPPAIRDQVTRLLERMSRAWETHDFAFLRGLWQLCDDAPVYLAEEDASFKRSHEELEDYWRRTEAGIVEVRGNYRLEAVMPLGKGFHSVSFRNEWAARECPSSEHSAQLAA